MLAFWGLFLGCCLPQAKVYGVAQVSKLQAGEVMAHGVAFLLPELEWQFLRWVWTDRAPSAPEDVRHGSICSQQQQPESSYSKCNPDLCPWGWRGRKSAKASCIWNLTSPSNYGLSNLMDVLCGDNETGGFCGIWASQGNTSSSSPLSREASLIPQFCLGLVFMQA